VKVQLKHSCHSRTVVVVTSLMSSHNRIKEVLKKGYSEVTTEKCYEDQNCFLSLQMKNSVDKLCQHELLHFVKIDSQ
jgi:hypothetical protein